MISNIDKSEAIPMLFIPSVEQTAMKTLKKEYALYIHIPYCEKKCHFCSIPVTRFTDEMVLDRYVDALLYELKYKEQFLKKKHIDRNSHWGWNAVCSFSIANQKTF